MDTYIKNPKKEKLKFKREERSNQTQGNNNWFLLFYEIIKREVPKNEFGISVTEPSVFLLSIYIYIYIKFLFMYNIKLTQA